MPSGCSRVPETVAVMTRAHSDDDELAARLAGRGVRVIELPCVRTKHLDDPAPLARAVAALDAADWLVITSRAGAEAVARAGRPRSRVAAVGEVTASCLRASGIAVDFQPSRATGADLARELPAADRALHARSDRALPDLAAILRERGFEVCEVTAYHTVVGASGDAGAVRTALEGAGDVRIYLWSPSAIDGLVSVVDPALVARATLVVIGPSTEAAARERFGPAARIETFRQEVGHGTRD